MTCPCHAIAFLVRNAPSGGPRGALPNYLDPYKKPGLQGPAYPRCGPDTNKISETGLTNLRGLARGGSLSTIRKAPRPRRHALREARRTRSLRHGTDADAPGRSGGARRAGLGEPRAASDGTDRRDSEPLPQQEPAWATAPRARGRDSTERAGDVSVRRLSYTPGASEDPLAPDETPQSALEVVVPDSMILRRP